MKKISIIGTVGIPACYGGFESLVENITLTDNEKITYTVFCSALAYDNKLKVHNNSDLIYIPLKANGIQSIPYDVLSLMKCWFIKQDVVLILGVSGCLFLPLFRLFSNSRVITNIDGLEWKRDKWNWLAKAFLKLSERVAVKYSDVIVADNEAISNYILQEYGEPSEVIAYGGDHAIRMSESGNENENEEYALGLCRIEPENNVHMILDAFSRTNNNLVFVGNWNSSEFGLKLKKKYSHHDNLTLIEPIYDLDRLYELRKRCSFYVHGHSAGGTNPSLVEMMHFGVPILAFDCDFNRFSTENRANYFKSSEDLINIISGRHICENNARAMKEIAVKRYTWKKIIDSYESLYGKSDEY